MLNNPLLTLKNTLNTVHKIDFLTIYSSTSQTTWLCNRNMHTVTSNGTLSIYFTILNIRGNPCPKCCPRFWIKVGLSLVLKTSSWTGGIAITLKLFNLIVGCKWNQLTVYINWLFGDHLVVKKIYIRLFFFLFSSLFCVSFINPKLSFSLSN